VEATIATLMGEGRSPATVDASAGRLEAAMEVSEGITPAALTELRSAIELLRDGQSCAAVSALLAVRSALGGRGCAES
jgi:hypothetical protein